VSKADRKGKGVVRIMDGADEWVGKAEKGVEEKEERNQQKKGR